jgi:hypothetical protein
MAGSGPATGGPVCVVAGGVGSQRDGGVMAAGGPRGRHELTAFQLEVATLFFALPASKGFLLAGGA